MKLQTRLTIATTVVITVISLAIGSFAIISTQNLDISRIDKILESDIKQLKENKIDPFSEAIYMSEISEIPLALGYIDPEGQLSVLDDSQDVLKKAPSTEQMLDGLLIPVSYGDPTIRFRTFQASENEFIIIGTSIAPIQGALTQKILLLFLFILVSVFLAVIVTNAFIKRDLAKISQLIESATQISTGSTDVSIPERVGNAEIDQLTDALSKMVTALQTSVEVERAAQIRMQEFLGDASHELRTPLTVLKGYIELLSANDSISSEDRKKIFDRLSSESKRMESLINDLLLLAELGETSGYQFEEVNISVVLQNSLNDLALLQPQRIIKKAIKSDIRINASSELIHQLIANITSNIRRHTPENAQVEISLKEVGNCTEIIFDDAGPGLPENAYKRSTQHFQRFDKSRDRQTGGSGLGMSIAFAIVKQHHGSMTLEKSPLGGLRTIIRLPY